MPRRRRRIGRIVLNALTGVSLLLCVGTVGLWVRSYWVAEGIGRGTTQTYTSVAWYRGGIIAQHSRACGGWTPLSWPLGWKLTGGDVSEAFEAGVTGVESIAEGIGDRRFRRLGIGYFEDSVSVYHTRVVTFPAWAPPAVGFGLCSASVLATLWRGRRRGLAGCPHCRYNLTGNVSGTCPECGTPVAAAEDAEDAAAAAGVAPPTGPAPKPDA